MQLSARALPEVHTCVEANDVLDDRIALEGKTFALIIKSHALTPLNPLTESLRYRELTTDILRLALAARRKRCQQLPYG